MAFDRPRGRGAVAAVFLIGASALTAEATFTARQQVASGLNAPMFVTHVPGDPTRLFIAERPGTSGSSVTANIRILNLTTGNLETTPFLSISGVNSQGEGGLLGLAFHPDYATNRKFYVYITANDSIGGDTPFSSYIREYKVSEANPNVADTGFTPVLTFTQPATNHNGGWIGFSPNDKYLYIMSGDGGDGNDQGSGHTEPDGNAQDLSSNFLGKTLRIDVDDVLGDDDIPDAALNYRIPDDNPFADVRDENRVVVTPVAGDDEIWAYGLRNPFRAGFDRVTGDLWVGDVGQERREEIDFQSGDSAGGQNYGWRWREGKIQTPGVGEAPQGAIEPIWDYKQDDAPDVLPADANFLGRSVIGGVPYRGPDPSLQGVYFFTDNHSSRIWTLTRPEGGGAPVVAYVTPMLPATGGPSGPSSIGEDANGNLYITYLNNGTMHRIVTNEFTPGDLNGDAKVDDADVATLTANLGMDTGADRVHGDVDDDNDVDGTDFLLLQQNYGWSPFNTGAPEANVIPEPASGGLAVVAALAVARFRRKR